MFRGQAGCANRIPRRSFGLFLRRSKPNKSLYTPRLGVTRRYKRDFRNVIGRARGSGHLGRRKKHPKYEHHLRGRLHSCSLLSLTSPGVEELLLSFSVIERCAQRHCYPLVQRAAPQSFLPFMRASYRRRCTGTMSVDGDLSTPRRYLAVPVVTPVSGVPPRRTSRASRRPSRRTWRASRRSSRRSRRPSRRS